MNSCRMPLRPLDRTRRLHAPGDEETRTRLIIATSPIDPGEGRLNLALPPQGESSRLSCSFTRTGGALDPVEGTLKLALPRTPLFIQSLLWHVDLPRAYRAETHGNLTRIPAAGGPPSRIPLRKNLCRDERPETRHSTNAPESRAQVLPSSSRIKVDLMPMLAGFAIAATSVRLVIGYLKAVAGK